MAQLDEQFYDFLFLIEEDEPRPVKSFQKKLAPICLKIFCWMSATACLQNLLKKLLALVLRLHGLCNSLGHIGGAVYALLFYLAVNLNLGFYAFLPVFFINRITYSGARLSRKTYLVDYALADQRPTYVSVANTFIGLFTLVAAAFGLIAQVFGLPAQIIFFIILLVIAILLNYKLKEVKR